MAKNLIYLKYICHKSLTIIHIFANLVLTRLFKTMYEQYLTQAGLTNEQAAIYEILVASGGLPAREITKKSPIKRGLVYKTLDSLIGLGLAEKQDTPGKVAIFRPTHPIKLKEMVDNKAQTAATAKVALNTVIDQLVSDYSLHVGRPGVQFFEGLVGVKKVLKDSLTSDTEIYSYIDGDIVDTHFQDLDAEYVKDRERLGIKKKNIIVDSPKTRSFVSSSNPEFTQNKLIDLQGQHLEATIQIYDGKITYMTLKPERLISVIITDDLIYKMHKSLFEFTWQSLSDIKPEPPLVAKPPVEARTPGTKNLPTENTD